MKLLDILIIILILVIVIIAVLYFSGYNERIYFDYPYFETPLDRLVRDGNYFKLRNPPFYNRGVPRIHRYGWM